MILVKNLLIEIISFLENNPTSQSEKEIISDLGKVSFEEGNYVRQIATSPPKKTALLEALNSINEKSLLGIKNAICDSIDHLNWSVDNGSFYEKGARAGEKYLNGNMHAELIGPRNGSYKFGQMRLGLFLLEPNIFYRDHKHEAPELYLNLTNGTYWRFDCSDWEEKVCGSIVYNEPFKVHAMYVNRIPFLSVWCWPNNSLTKCVVISKEI